jgi:hypothetical protein
MSIRAQSNSTSRKSDILRGLLQSPCSSSNSLLARPALPDANGLALNAGLAAKAAGIPGVLRNLHLLDLFSERGTVSLRCVVSYCSCPSLCCRFWIRIPSTVLAGHSDLCNLLERLSRSNWNNLTLGSLRHVGVEVL